MKSPNSKLSDGKDRFFDIRRGAFEFAKKDGTRSRLASNKAEIVSFTDGQIIYLGLHGSILLCRSIKKLMSELQDPPSPANKKSIRVMYGGIDYQSSAPKQSRFFKIIDGALSGKIQIGKPQVVASDFD
jgi:hypothetical protein